MPITSRFGVLVLAGPNSRKVLQKLTDADLVTALSMGCPFTPEEKQALLEASDLPARAELLETLFAMGAREGRGGGSETTRH